MQTETYVLIGAKPIEPRYPLLSGGACTLALSFLGYLSQPQRRLILGASPL